MTIHAFTIAPQSRVSIDESPIRAELFSVERLEEHARTLAAAQRVARNPERGRLLAHRLADNAKVLRQGYRAFVKATHARQPITPAAEWLLDNFHVVDEQIREIRDDLPPGFYRRLPKLAEGPLQGYPRVFGIAWALVAHTDSAIDLEKITRFVVAYQQVQPLTIGELWALAITLRITLVENLRRVAEIIAARLAARQLADTLADRILGTDSSDPDSAASALQALNRAPWSTAFAVQLAQRLRDHDPSSTPALRWLTAKLTAEGATIDEAVRDQVQRQSAMNVTVRNIVESMRLVSMTNWAEFFESVSAVDAIMRRASGFAAMDFSTRDLYRRAIETLARASDREETDVAERVIAAVRRAVDKAPNVDPDTRRECDPGFYLIAKGRRAFERELGCRTPISTWVFRVNANFGVSSYVGMIAAGTAIVLGVALGVVAHVGIGGWALAALAMVGLIPASDLAVAVVNRLIGQSVGPTLLPGLELREGLPADLSTIIVVPTLLTSTAANQRQIERLEVHYLSNPDDNFSFALLSDWTDSDAEHSAEDQALLDDAAAGVARLNAHYGPVGNRPRFFLLHRRRVWNEGEGKWIGWERKRGKLHELNRLLRGARDTTFVPVDGHPPTLPDGIRYVLTLDADSRLPIGSARRMVGKIAHPLNRPVFDPSLGRVVHGHAILQPRVTPSLPIASQGSLFQRVFSGPNGLDPYALAISDVYQDLFEEGSYCGKGIYHVDAFEASLEGQIPDNTVLSHDLLEGILARAGLISDIEVVEEFPSRYDVAAARQHRWVRGDWQLLPWVFGMGAKLKQGAKRAALPLMGRWKLLDNLRRSLSAPTALLALIVGWLLPTPAAELWSAYILLTIVAPPMLPAIAGLVPSRGGVSLRSHMRSLRDDFLLGLMQSAFLITFLAHQAWLMVDAVVRTLGRVLIHRRRLLEWVTSAQADSDFGFSPRQLSRQIAASVASAAVVIMVIVRGGHHPWWIAAPLVTVWGLSPLIARWSSRTPSAEGHLAIPPGDATTLRLIARRTWRFFEAFVTAEDNMLPPDNFQEDPRPVVAHRTSPTNIGLYLLSALAARDFGWLGMLDSVERLEATFATMDRLERLNGHFFNWYDTSDLRALEPKYVSSVDSGNLAGHLIALANGCSEMIAQPIGHPCWVSGLEDSLALLRESIRSNTGASPKGDTRAGLETSIQALAEALREAALDPAHAAPALPRLARLADNLVASAGLSAGDSDEDEITVWAAAFRETVATHQRDFDAFMPWATSLGQDAPSATAMAELMRQSPPLSALPALCRAASKALAEDGESHADAIASLEQSADAAEAMAVRLGALADRARAMAMSMAFGFLYDPDRLLLSIGYRSEEGDLDGNVYDLLASEARLASFFAIAKGDLPAKHWFQLGRTMTPIDGGSGLISWSGSMFEYLMPSLVMRAPSGSLLEQTNRLVIWRQEAYAKRLGVPWGMSESEYNIRDIEQTYQYSSFGVPDLGYKRGLNESIVVAPYASGLAAMIAPAAAARNFRRMAEAGARGAYGWCEAIDYTPGRVPQGKTFAVCRAYMAHHQAMTIIGIGNAIHDGLMRARFHAEPMIQAAELLLQERMPRGVALARKPTEDVPAVETSSLTPDTQRHYSSPHSRVPRTHLLSNGRYSAMVTAAGSGYSRWRDVAITRWREDVTSDGWGAFIFLRDLTSGQSWSAGYKPSVLEPDTYDVTFSEDRAQIIRHDDGLTTTLEIAISPEDDAEVRRVSITNHGVRTREIELTSYAELALARQADDLAHPAFSKLFVETEFLPDLGAILATRRQRSSADPKIWAAHVAVVEGESSADVQFETDRARFLGRGQTLRAAAAITDHWPLSNTAGAVLDPIFSLRRRIKIRHGATARIAFWTLAAGSREELLGLVDRHHDSTAFERATTLAWTQAQMQLHHLGIGSDDAHLFQRLANHVLYPDSTLRPLGDVLKRGAGKASTLWAHGISGDLPIVLACVNEHDELELVRQLLRAHEYWRLKRLAVDLVILNQRTASYDQDLQTSLEALVRANQSMPMASEDARGAVFVLRGDLIGPAQDRLQATARAVLHGDRGSLAEQVNAAHNRPKPAAAPPPRDAPAPLVQAPPPRPRTEFFNGLGGFTNDGRDYLTVLGGRERTPAPWVNIIANPTFGFQVSTEGSGFTWAGNSQQNQLTPWSNDPVGDAPGEVVYVRDDDTGEVWGPTALPIRQPGSTYSARHGQGFSQFSHESHDIGLELLQFIPTVDPIKISRLKITNQSERERRLSVTAYVEWVLGANRSATAPYVITEADPQTAAIFAQNPWNDQFADRVAFADLEGRQTAWTCDRTEFLGRDGELDRPLGLMGGLLSHRAGAGLDPCAALQTQITIAAGGSAEVVFCLGQAATKEAARTLIMKYRQTDIDGVLAQVTRQWDETLGAVQIRTPDRALDILMNRWLPYQTLACRVWARTGFYQASGAYGFRDQLQDVMALCVSRPDVARQHLLRAAGRQFAEGDVQHWWLPESGRGVRTRVSDDRAWLAYVVAHYVEVTGDLGVLDEPVPFLAGPRLGENEHDAFFEPTASGQTASLFDHCALALDSSLKVGVHGLPLMGTGDWNDGMDRVGEQGKGESVWLGWLLCSALASFADLAEPRGDDERASAWRAAYGRLQESLEQAGWDGDWYRRAYFDDGAPLGSVSNTQCRIDAISQSWAVISGAADPERAARAMEAVDRYLIRDEEQLSLLFTPPFDNPAQDPGYIKGYPAGIRENGGQYTQGAVWTAMAFAMRGDGDKAGALLSMLNPIRHADSPAGMQRYRVEPYVIAADVYSVPPHVGRGGWTWYTGSAGWMYRTALEGLLGFRLRGANLVLDPCIPHGWRGYEIVFHYRSSRYEILIENPLGVCRGVLAIKLDGVMLPGGEGQSIPLVDDGETHRVQLVLGSAQA